MRVLVACEFSGVAREAFRKRGHDAWSCDLLPAADGSPHHFQDDVLNYYLADDWDLMIAHPPCTYLTCAQNKWMLPRYADRFPNRKQQQREGIEFFLELASSSIPRIAIENPVGIMSTHYCKPDQIIEPYHYGHDARKKTALWLTGLPKLIPTNIVVPTIVTTRGGNTMSKWHVNCGQASNMAERAMLRSVTFQGIANAMAEQWG